MRSLIKDVNVAARVLAKDRGFSITAGVTLALVIGANVAIFSVINSVLLRPLPFEEADALVRVFNSYPNAGVERASNSAPDYFDRRRGVAALEEVANFADRDFTVDRGGVPGRVRGMRVTPSFFPLLRVRAGLGRTFTEAEGEVGNEARVVLSHSLWEEMFGAERGIVGREMRVNGVPHQIVGVMPEGFSFLDPGIRMWVPQAFAAEEREAYHSNSWEMVGRLGPGASIEAAQAQVDAINARHLEQYPQFREALVNAGYHTRVVPLQQDLVRNVRRSFVLLWAGVIFVLLIGCVNVANLALVRAAGRVRDLSMRVALGAGRNHLARSLVAESVLLTVASAAVGVGLGWTGIRALFALGVDRLPRGAEVGIDATVLLVTLGAALAIGAILGLIPLLHLGRVNTASVLRAEGRSATIGRRGRLLRRGMVAAQVATAFLLLIGAGLLFASFRQIVAIDPGFEPEGVVTGWVVLPAVRYPQDDDQRIFARRALESIRSLAGVEAASLTGTIPFGDSFSDSVILAEGYEMKPGESLVSPNQIVAAPGYFEAMGIPLVEGRFFSDGDTADAMQAVIVDESLASRFWPGRSPLGKRMYRPTSAEDIYGTDEDTNWFTVVGVIGDIKLRDLLDQDSRVGSYCFPFEQSTRRGIGIVIRTSQEPTTVVESVRRAIAAIDPELPLFDVVPLADRISDSLVAQRSPMLLTLVFAGVALFLAAVGLYGVLAYLVTQRNREIGIRMALGGTPDRIFRLIVGEGLGILGVGIAAGLALVVLLRGVLQGQLYGVGPLDPLVLGAVVSVLSLAAVAACAVPALRATRVHPAVVLHE